MKKIFRMANAELNKIFMRPSMFVLATVLVVALVLSFFCFEPTSSSTKYTYELNTTTAMGLKFEQEYKSLEEKLILAKEDALYYSIPENDTFESLKAMSANMANKFDIVYDTILNASKNNLYPTQTDKEKIINQFASFEDSVKELKDYLLVNIKDKSINFFITVSEFEKVYNTVKNIDEAIPTENQLNESTYADIIERLNLINDSFNIVGLNSKITELEKIEVDSAELTLLLEKYYYPNITETTDGVTTTYTHTGKLKEMYDAVVEIYIQNPESAEESVKAQLNEKIAQFYDYIQINVNLIENNFELLRIGTKSDDEIMLYNGFSGISIYNLKQEITLSEYYLKNNTFGYEYLNAFNFNINSGINTNAFDFTFFAMQILSCLIILFVIFFASSAISGEQNSGTLKMTAIRPFSRNKIYSGKFLACFNVALILLLVSLASSLAVGAATFGFTSQQVLVVMNASEVFVMHPALLLLIYFATLLIDIVFYISLSILISMLIKSTTINTGVTAGLFLASTIISGTVTASWSRFIPTTHLGLFKYFTTSKTGMLSFSVVPNTNFIISLIIIIISIFTFDLIGRLMFSRKSIDK